MSRYSARFISTILIFVVIGGIGMHSFAADSEEVQAVRKQFSTSEEVTSIHVTENGSPITIRYGESSQIFVNYADTSKEKLYDIDVNNGILTIKKLKEPPKKTISVNGITIETIDTESYYLDIVLPQKQYETISISNSRNCDVILNSISSKEFSVDLKNGDATFLQTQSDNLYVDVNNGSIYFDNISSVEYHCQAINGDITGSVIGDSDIYTVEARANNGSCNLKSHTAYTGNYLMELYSKNGDIEVFFGNS